MIRRLNPFKHGFTSHGNYFLSEYSIMQCTGHVPIPFPTERQELLREMADFRAMVGQVQGARQAENMLLGQRLRKWFKKKRWDMSQGHRSHTEGALPEQIWDTWSPNMLKHNNELYTIEIMRAPESLLIQRSKYINNLERSAGSSLKENADCHPQNVGSGLELETHHWLTIRPAKTESGRISPGRQI